MTTMNSGFNLRACIGFFALALLFSFNANAWAESQTAKDLVNNTCSTCHKFEGKPESKFNLKAPDLMWGGNKYQRSWLLRYLQGKEENLYPKGYRWDQGSEPFKHIALSEAQANSVADYFEKNFIDKRVEKSFVDMSTFNEMEKNLGEKIYRDFSCLGCHQIKEDGQKIGGPISVNLYDAGNRYTLDWWTQFAKNPQDFTPHSGEYLADITPLQARYIIGYVMTLGVEDFNYFKPWETEPFKKADAKRGSKVYKEYCAQCHGAQGRGDGPGASGLDPKPAVHADLPLSDYPDDYLYFLIYYGGKSVGKSPNMPNWGPTIPTQGIADVIAYLRTTFKGE